MSPLFSTRFNIVRTSLYLFLLLCTIVVLGLDAHAISGTNLVGGVLAFIIFLTVWTLVLVVPLVFVLPLVRPGFAFTQLKFELGVLGMLWIMWLAAAADTSNKFSFYLSYCGGSYRTYYGSLISGADCSQPRALLAFSWLAWLTLTALLGYTATLAFLEHNKGHTNVWHTPTPDYPFGTTVATNHNNTTHDPAVAHQTGEVNKEQVHAGNKEYEQPQVVVGAPVQQQQVHQEV